MTRSLTLATSLVVLACAPAVAAPPAAKPAARSPVKSAAAPVLVVDGAVPRPLRLTAAQVRALPRARQATDGRKGKATFDGVRLSSVLAAAGVTIGKHQPKHHPVEYVVVEASDGYEAVFSLAEIDPSLGNQPVLVADTRDGAALAADEGPWRLVVPGDGMRSRWVRQVVRIRLAVPEQRATRP